MSDKNKHIDKLESFFRKGVEKADFNFVEEDWAKMEKMLDERQPVVPVTWWRSGRIWIPVVLALVVFTALYVWQNERSGAGYFNENPEVRNGDMQEIQSDRSGTGFRQLQDMEQETNTAENYTGNKQQSMRSDAAAVVPRSNLYGQEQTRAGGGAAPSAAYAASVQKSDNKGGGEDIGAAPARFGLDQPVADGAEERITHPLVPVRPKPFAPEPGIRRGIYALQYIPKAGRPNVPQHTAGQSDYTFDSFKRYLAVGFTVSPDYSAVGFSNFGNSGSRVGMVIEYGLSRRFVINTGFVLTNNKYEADGRDYQAPYGFWTKGVVPAQTYGECRIVDIPVNIRYNIGLWNRHRLFVNAGASSYIMMREKYYYSYYNDDPDLISEWENSKPSVHWFGIGNASIGYEYMLSPRLSVQAEPFVKFALTGIGYGSVELNSFGAYFTLKYSILR
jgi:hypothetical protein